MQTVIVAVLTVLVFSSCHTGHSALDQTSEMNPFARYRTLGDALRIYSGLQVTGTGLQQTVTVSRNSSMRNTEPLFVLNGFPMGNNYHRANQAIDMAEVKQIRFLRTVSETAKYGAEGSSGVILISTDANRHKEIIRPSQNQVIIGSVHE